MNKLNAVIMIVVFLFIQNLNADTYKIDKNKTEINWTGKKLAGQHNGLINIKSGNLKVENGELKSGTINVDMSSLTVLDIKDSKYNKKLLNHLQSDDFFSTNKYPSSQLKIKSIKSIGKNKVKITADLTIKGITKSVVFETNFEIKGKKLTAKAKIIIDRTKYDITYSSGNFFENLGDKLIHDNFELDINLVAFK